MRQSSLGVIQRVEARYRLAVEVGHGELGFVGVCCVKLLQGSRGKIRLAQVGQVPFRYGSRGKSWSDGVCLGKLCSWQSWLRPVGSGFVGCVFARQSRWGVAC